MGAASKVDQADSLVEILINRAAQQPDETAYHFIGERSETDIKLSYAELLREAASLAVSLQIMGLQGQPVLLACKTNLFFVVGLYACLMAGALAVPTAPPRRQALEQRIDFLVQHSGATAALTDSDAMLGMEVDLTMIDVREGRPCGSQAHPSRWEPGDFGGDSPAVIQYTSGTIGDPHGVVHSHRALLAASAAAGASFGHDEHSAILITLPLFHELGLMYGVLHPLAAGLPVYLMTPAQFVQRPHRWLRLIQQHRITTAGGPNFMFDIVTRTLEPEALEALDLSSLHACFCTGEPVRSGTMARLTALLNPVGLRPEALLPCYSLSEVGRHLTGAVNGKVASTDLPHIAGAVHPVVSCGKPHADCRLLIIDPVSRCEVAGGQVGEIWLRCDSNGLGYWNEPLVTEAVFAARLENGDGPFIRSGDAAYMRDGELYVLGRLADRIRIAGSEHAPQDLELQAERSHEGLRPSCAAAFTIDGIERARLVVVCELKREMLRSREKWPYIEVAIRSAIRRVHGISIDEVVLLRPGGLPKTSSGKVRRNQCRADYLDGVLPVAQRFNPAQGADCEPGGLIDH